MPILCAIDGCGVRARTSGRCHKHTLCKCGMQRVSHRTTCKQPGCKRPRPSCAFRGCTNLSYVRGKCRKHSTPARKRLQCINHRCSAAAVSAVLGKCYKHSECKLDICTNSVSAGVLCATHTKPVYLGQRVPAVYKACEIGDWGLAEMLLVAGSHGNAVPKDSLWSPLLSAAWAGKTKICRLLLQSGAAISDTTTENFTAMHLAICGGEDEDTFNSEPGIIDVLEVLIGFGGNVHATANRICFEDLNGVPRGGAPSAASIIGLAAQYAYTDVVRFLISKGASLMDALKNAAEDKHADAVICLIGVGGDISRIPQGAAFDFAAAMRA